MNLNVFEMKSGLVSPKSFGLQNKKKLQIVERIKNIVLVLQIR